MLMSAYQLGFGGGRPAASVSQTAAAASASDLTEYTFSGLSLGVAAVNRKIVVIVGGFVNSDTINTVTVGGVSTTTIIEQAVTEGFLELRQADVPTGTTGDVVVTWSAGVSNCLVGVYRVIGATDAAFDTGVDTTDTLNDTLNIPTGGVVIGGAFSAAGASASFSWTNLTEDFEQQAGAESTFITGASNAFAGGEVARSISCQVTNETSGVAMLLASWGPT